MGRWVFDFLKTTDLNTKTTYWCKNIAFIDGKKNVCSAAFSTSWITPLPLTVSEFIWIGTMDRKRQRFSKRKKSRHGRGKKKIWQTHIMFHDFFLGINFTLFQQIRISNSQSKGTIGMTVITRQFCLNNDKVKHGFNLWSWLNHNGLQITKMSW